MLGQDVRDWPLPPAGKFDGVIGGPPCQEFSNVRHIGGGAARHPDMIGFFWRVVEQVKPRWAVMENLTKTVRHPEIPDDAAALFLRDWDCGGKTNRRRAFYVWPGMLFMSPGKREGNPEYSVLAGSHKTGLQRQQRSMHAGLSALDAGRLQCRPEIADTMLRESNKGRIFPQRFIVHCLGNGVPRFMGEFVARKILYEHHVEREAKKHE
ncbi:MAG: DNA cytosine methyltransferase [Gammaproteobacteria bacterium]|nr:DNA cytosine methyltransferase [Gammaproteobacteria bacterium]